MVSIPNGNGNGHAGANRPPAYHEHQPSLNAPSGMNGASGAVNRLPEEITDYIRAGQSLLNQCGHIVFVYDSAARLIFRNTVAESHALAAQSQPASSSSAQSWRIICECVTDAVAAAIRNGQPTFSAVIPVQQQSFVITGSLVGRSGRITGAIANVSELASGAVPGIVPQSQQAAHVASSGLISAESGDSSGNREELLFQCWVRRRAEARRRMQKLSRRESQVATLVSQGKANKSIARELDISVKTIEKHRANAVRKLGVSSTPEMVRITVIAEDDPEDLPGSAARVSPQPESSSAGPVFASHHM